MKYQITQILGQRLKMFTLSFRSIHLSVDFPFDQLSMVGCWAAAWMVRALGCRGVSLLRAYGGIHVLNAESHKHPLYQLNFRQTRDCLIDFDLTIVLSSIVPLMRTTYNLRNIHSDASERHHLRI